MKKTHALVIGGGPSGLSFAYEFQGDTLILEKENQVGGLCRSICQEGGVFDIGGHSFHTPYPEVFELIQSLSGSLYLQQRQARVYSHGTLIPYPFQKYYDQLPDNDVVNECEQGLQHAIGGADQANNFEEYLIRKFGDGIAKHFMLPYNRKLWARDIREISCEWTSERVAGAKGEKESFDIKGGKRKPLQPDTRVGYPEQGGFEELYKSFVPHIPSLQLNAEVVHIDPNAHIVTTVDGNQFEYEILISTIPIPILVRLVDNAPSDIIAQADRLPFMSLSVAMLLVGHPLDTPIQRIYVADPEVPPHKIALNHNSSESLRQQPHHAITAEVSYSDYKHLNRDEVISKTIAFLSECDIIRGPDDIIWSGHVDAHYAYPVYTHERPMLVKAIKDWLQSFDILTLGRFGDWEYINSDKCVMKGIELARKLRSKA